MPILDQFHTYQASLNSPVEGGFDIAPADGVDLPEVTRAIMVGGTGDVAVVLKSGDTLTLTGLAVGVIYPVRVVQVLTTGTTATGLKGLV